MPRRGRAVAAEGEQSALLVRVAAVETVAEYAVEREYVGRVEARRRAQVGFELGGELAAVAVDEGDRVESGAVLARLDTARLEARRAEARAALEQARSASEFAERSRERNEVAADFDGVSAQELDLAVDRANAAAAGLAAAEARLATVEVDLSKSSLRAPFDAVVVRRRFDEGQIVAAGQPVLDVQELAPPDVRAAPGALEHEDFGAGLGGTDRRAGAGAAQADDEDVGLGVPFADLVDRGGSDRLGVHSVSPDPGSGSSR